jgi:hypothetical protein
MRGISFLVFAVRNKYGAAMFAPQDVTLHRHCEERSDEAIQLSLADPWIASLRSQ